MKFHISYGFPYKMSRMVKNLFGKKGNSVAQDDDAPPGSTEDEASRQRRAPNSDSDFESDDSHDSPSDTPQGPGGPTSTGMSRGAGSGSGDPRTLITFRTVTGTIRPSKVVHRNLYKIFCRRWFLWAYCWKALREEDKLFYFIEFRKLHRWECSNEVMFARFEKKARRYTDALYKMRGNEEKRAKVDIEIYAEWEKKWDKPSFQ